MRTLLFHPAAFALAWATLLPGCAGCSDECAGNNQGAEGCPCGSDQDCAALSGAELLCLRGACTVQEPPTVLPDVGPCDADGACGEGLGCGIDGDCFPAPACQRIDVPLTFHLEGGATGPVVASRADCEHTWSTDGAASFAVRINLEGNITGGCEGHWFAAARVGELSCAGNIMAVAPADVAACVACELCEPVAGSQLGVAVCP